MPHNHFHRLLKRVAKPQDDTAVSIVYVTASPTFKGEIGGYTTLGVAINTKTTPAAIIPTAVPKGKPSSSVKIEADTSSTPVVKPSATSKHSTFATSASTGLPTIINAPTTSLGSTFAILAATGGLASTSTTISAPTSSATSDSSTSETAQGGMSTGGKAGMAIGILLLVGAVLSIILFCFKKRRNAAKEAEARESEKYAAANNLNQRAASVRTTATAPRLSLRPITQFSPTWGDRRQSRGNPLGPHLAPTAEPHNEKTSAWERPMTANSNNTENPFGTHAETIPAPVQNPFGAQAETIDATNARGAEEVVVPAAAAAAVAAAPLGLKRGASKRENRPAPMDFTKSGPLMGPPSPTGTEFSVTSASPGTPVQTSGGAAIAAAGGPANSAVHRVQLDFNPSMEDELELKQGQLIRVLHEYDDGWALCIRLDRSQQGVAPRTCLSTRPVKPRPMQGGPGPRGPPPGMRGPGPQGRPQSPAMNGQRMGPGPQGRPQSPAMSSPRMAPGPLQVRPNTPNGPKFRPASPAGSMQQRPQSPSGSVRSMNPQQDRSRSNSSSQMQAGPRFAQPGPSPMNPTTQFDGTGSSPPQGAPIRKPVPGQAL